MIEYVPLDDVLHDGSHVKRFMATYHGAMRAQATSKDGREEAFGLLPNCVLKWSRGMNSHDVAQDSFCDITKHFSIKSRWVDFTCSCVLVFSVAFSVSLGLL